jgi:hypothetical protein
LISRPRAFIFAAYSKKFITLFTCINPAFETYNLCLVTCDL